MAAHPFPAWVRLLQGATAGVALLAGASLAASPLPPPERVDKEAIRQATQAYTAIIERFVREHPDQWIWLHRRWRTQPLEEAKTE